MRYYASKEKMPDYGFSPDAEFPLINIEKGGVNRAADPRGSRRRGRRRDSGTFELYAGERPNVVPAHAEGASLRRRPREDRLHSKALKNRRRSRDVKLTTEKLSVRDLGDGRAEISAEGMLSPRRLLPEQGVNAAGMLMIALEQPERGQGAIAAGADTLAE